MEDMDAIVEQAKANVLPIVVALTQDFMDATCERLVEAEVARLRAAGGE